MKFSSFLQKQNNNNNNGKLFTYNEVIIHFYCYNETPSYLEEMINSKS